MNAVADLTLNSSDSKQKHTNKAAWGALFAGAALSVYGWTRKSASGAALGLAGGAIALKAASAGPIADLVGTETSLSHSVLMMASPAEIYAFCKQIGGAPLWIGAMRDLSAEANQSEITGKKDAAEGSKTPEFQILEDVPDQRICWKIAESRRDGRDCVAELRFDAVRASRGTLVTLALRFKLHTGILHSGAAQGIGADPQRQLRESLRKLKMLIEAGEIATIEGQSHGPRALKGKLIGTLLAEQSA